MALTDVLIKIGGDTSKYEKSLSNIQLYTKKTTQFIQKYWIAAAAAITGLGYYVTKSLDYADTLGKTASKIGVTTDELQEYRYAAKLAGVEQSQLDMGLQRFSRRIGEVAAGTGELKAVAEKYHIQLRDSNGQMRSNSAILADFAEVIKHAESEQEQLRIAFKLFDSEGAALVNMLKGGASELDAVRKKAHDLGMVMDADLIAKAEDINDELATMATIMKTQLASAIIDLGPAITGLAQWIANVAAETGNAIEGFKIFFGLGEENKLKKELTSVMNDLRDIEDETKRLNKIQEWQEKHPMLTEGKYTKKQLEELEAEWKILDERRKEITKQHYDLQHPPEAGGKIEVNVPAGLDDETIKKVDKALQDYFKDLDKLEPEMAKLVPWYYEWLKQEEEIKNVDAALKNFFDDLDELIPKIDEQLSSYFGEVDKAEKDYKQTLQNIDEALEEFFEDIEVKTEKTFGEEMSNAVTGWASNMSSELTDLVMDADLSFREVLRAYVRMLMQMVIQKKMVEPALEWGSNVENWISIFASIGSWFVGGGGGNVMGSLPQTYQAARGKIFSGPGIAAFENQVINRPALFPFAHGVGLMGEAGRYEGILPLTRTRSGDLGVKAEGGGLDQASVNIIVQGNQVWDQRSLQMLVTRVSAAVARNVAPGAIARDFNRDGITRRIIRGG